MLQGSFGAISRTPSLHEQSEGVAFQTTMEMLLQQTIFLHTKPTYTAHRGNTTHAILPLMLPVAEYKAYILHARPVGCQFSLCAAVPGSVLLTTLLYPWQSFHSAECREHATSASTNMQSSRMFTPTHVQLTNGGQVPRDLAVDHCTGRHLPVFCCG